MSAHEPVNVLREVRHIDRVQWVGIETQLRLVIGYLFAHLQDEDDAGHVKYKLMARAHAPKVRHHEADHRVFGRTHPDHERRMFRKSSFPNEKAPELFTIFPELYHRPALVFSPRMDRRLPEDTYREVRELAEADLPVARTGVRGLSTESTEEQFQLFNPNIWSNIRISENSNCSRAFTHPGAWIADRRPSPSERLSEYGVQTD